METQPKLQFFNPEAVLQHNLNYRITEKVHILCTSEFYLLISVEISVIEK